MKHFDIYKKPKTIWHHHFLTKDYHGRIRYYNTSAGIVAYTENGKAVPQYLVQFAKKFNKFILKK